VADGPQRLTLSDSLPLGEPSFQVDVEADGKYEERAWRVLVLEDPTRHLRCMKLLLSRPRSLGYTTRPA